ncbi:MAG: LysM peptidoglycan-binding domain-containing M23 family metallopeptidase [bacterium]|nr:LysM peptidoglycan-binding domain-containing M23 family metallopeptidase [bacterium]
MTEKKNYFEDELPPNEDKDLLEDTRPTGIFPQVPVAGDGKRIIGLLLIFMAIGLTFGTVAMILSAPSNPPVSPSATVAPEIVAQTTDAVIPTSFIATPPPQMTINGDLVKTLPILDNDTARQLLAQPISNQLEAVGGRVGRNLLDPFTIVPARPRNEVIQYVAVQGDTIDSIATRFNLQSETIAWSNSRKIIQVLRPGDVVIIPPEDGVYIKTFGSATIAEMTELYKLTDPYIVLDSPYNRVVVQEQNLTPDSTPRNGTPLFFPGGEGEQVVWQVTIEIIEGDTSNTDNTNNSSAPPAPSKVVFQNGEQGSCPPQEIVGGSYWSNPLDGGYTITRGYTSWHSGIDLATPIGTPVKAANSGRVIFSGWNSFGFGYMVALVHGPTTITIYAHLLEPNVICGQDVVAGQVIGTSGNSGNSSGPHLHFEIRGTSNNVSQDPSSIITF